MPNRRLREHEKAFSKRLLTLKNTLQAKRLSDDSNYKGRRVPTWIRQPWLNLSMINPKRWLYHVGFGYNNKVQKINKRINYFIQDVNRLNFLDEDGEYDEQNFIGTYDRVKQLLDLLGKNHFVSQQIIGGIENGNFTIQNLTEDLGNAKNTYEEERVNNCIGTTNQLQDLNQTIDERNSEITRSNNIIDRISGVMDISRDAIEKLNVLSTVLMIVDPVEGRGGRTLNEMSIEDIRAIAQELNGRYGTQGRTTTSVTSTRRDSSSTTVTADSRHTFLPSPSAQPSPSVQPSPLPPPSAPQSSPSSSSSP